MISLNATAKGTPCSISWWLRYFTLCFLTLVYGFVVFISLKNATKLTIIRAALKTQWRPTGYSHYNCLNGKWSPQFLTLGVKTKPISSYLILPTPVPLLHVYCNLLTIVSKWPAVYTDGDFQTSWLSSCESLSCGCLLFHMTVDKSTACRKTGSRCHGLIELIFYFKCFLIEDCTPRRWESYFIKVSSRCTAAIPTVFIIC